MDEREGLGKELNTELLEEDPNRVERMQGWLRSPDGYIQEMEKAETLIIRLLQERKALLEYVRALRFWAYEVIGGSVRMNDQPTDMFLLLAMMKLPDFLRKEIQSQE